VVVRDSAGIHIVENVTPVWTATSARRLNPVPTLTLGSVTGSPDQKWRRVWAAARLSDGSIAVAPDVSTHQIQIFDNTGKLHRRIRGDGRSPAASFIPSKLFGLPRDTLLMWNWWLQRLTWFTAGGMPVRTLGVKQKPDILGPTNVQVGSFLDVFGTLPDGGVLAVDHPASTYRPTGNYHDSMYVLRLPPDGKLVPIAFVASAESSPYVPSTHRSRWGIRPLTAPSSVAAGTRSLYYTDGVHFEIREYGVDGKVLRIIRVRRMPPPVTDRDIAAFRAGEYDQPQFKASPGHVPRQEDLAFVAGYLKWVTYPKILPAFTGLVTEKDGTIWAREYGDEKQAQHWDAFNHDGRLLGAVDFPAGIDVLEIGADYVLGRFTDDNFVQSLRLYRFVR
jgi:hypothetical protein